MLDYSEMRVGLLFFCVASGQLRQVILGVAMSLFNQSNLSSESISCRDVEEKSNRWLSVGAGLALFFYGYEVVAAPLVAASLRNQSPAPVANGEQRSVWGLYVPAPNETLEHIAARFSLDTNDMVVIQQRAATYGWRGGVVLIPHRGQGELAFTPLYVLHKLRKGESLASLALVSNRSEKELLRLNGALMGAARVVSLREGDPVLLPAPKENGLPGKVDPVAAEREQEIQQAEQRILQSAVQAAQMYEASNSSRGSGQDFDLGGLVAQQVAGGVSSSLSRELGMV